MVDRIDRIATVAMQVASMVAYAAMIGVGVYVVLHPPRSLTDDFGATWSHALGALAAAFAATAFAAAGLRRLARGFGIWVIEFVSCSQLVGAIATYTILEWLLVKDNPGGEHQASGFALTALLALFVFELSYMWRYRAEWGVRSRIRIPR